MAKKPVKPTSGSGATPRRPRAPEPAPAETVSPEPASPEPAAAAPEPDDLEGELLVSASELDELERRLNAGLTESEPDEDAAPEAAVAPRAEAAPARVPRMPARKEPVDSGEEETPEVATGASDDEAAAPGRRSASKGFGPSEWAALAGFGVLALVGAALFFKFLYAHPAPTQGEGLPDNFSLPLTGPSVRLSGAESGWRARVEGDKARAEEAVLPVISLTLDSSQASSGFVRVEFVDPDDKIRGDIMILAVEGGRFKDGGRGEVIAEGGLRVDLTGTVGFRSHALFSSYMAGQDPRWSVRIKEGPDSSNGPWTQLGAALISNTKH